MPARVKLQKRPTPRSVAALGIVAIPSAAARMQVWGVLPPSLRAS